jgi:hypothetical protein
MPKKKAEQAEQDRKFYLSLKVGAGGIDTTMHRSEEKARQILGKLLSLPLLAPTWWRIYTVDAGGNVINLERGGEEP